MGLLASFANDDIIIVIGRSKEFSLCKLLFNLTKLRFLIGAAHTAPERQLPNIRDVIDKQPLFATLLPTVSIGVNSRRFAVSIIRIL